VDSEDVIILLDVVSPFNLQGKKKGLRECVGGVPIESSSDTKVSFFLSFVLYLWVMNHVPVFVVCEPFIDGTHKMVMMTGQRI
jgi:hypothetical protein